MCLREGLLGARDPLAQCLFRHKKRTRDLRRGEAADQAQRERDASFRRKHGIARGEDEPQQLLRPRWVLHPPQPIHILRYHHHHETHCPAPYGWFFKGPATL